MNSLSPREINFRRKLSAARAAAGAAAAAREKRKSAPPKIDMSPDNPLFAYTCGLAAALEAASKRGDTAIFAPLRTEFERALVELRSP